MTDYVPLLTSPTAASDAHSSARLADALLLSDLEPLVRNYETAGLEAGRALRLIRDNSLYLPPHADYGKFEDYVADQFTFKVRQAQYLMRHADLADEFEEAGVAVPATTAQSRALLKLPEGARAEKWKRLLEEHGTPDAVKASDIESTPTSMNARLSVDAAPEAGLDLDDFEDDAGEVELGAAGDGFSEDEARLGTSAGRAAVVPEMLARSAVVSAHPRGDARWPYGDDAHARFLKVPAVDQEAVRDALAFATMDEDVTAETVEDAAQFAAAERTENNGRSGQPGVIGVAVGIVELSRKRLLDTTREIQIDIDYVPEVAQEIGGEPQTYEAGTCNIDNDRGRKAAPLLVVIASGLCPDALLDAHPGARRIAEQKAELIVEISELETFGGPVRNGVLDIEAVRQAAREAGIRKVFNKTGALVGWANYSTNPLTGCTHNCQRQFCYASDVALRFYPQAFVPTIHPARLDAFSNTSLPTPERTSPLAPGWARSVFLGSMGDLFNHSFPDWWIRFVLDEIASHPEWTVFVLTKMGPRLGDFEFPANAAVGVTVTRDKDVRAAAKGLASTRGGAFKWVSLEPFLDRVDVEPLLDAGATLFAVGGQSKTRWSGELQPDPVWVRDAVKAIYARDAHFYSKDNLDWRGHIPFPGREPWAVGASKNAKLEARHGDGVPYAAAPDRAAVPSRGPKPGWRKAG